MSELFGVARLPRHLVFGRGQRATLGYHVASLGRRALLVTDDRMASGAECEALMKIMCDAGISCRLFAGVLAEVPLGCIEAGVAAGQAHDSDVVIGLGGGSCIDAAKAISLLLHHGGQLSDYYGEHNVPGPIAPIVAVPTTAGTGSEVTPVAVVTDSQRVLKVGISSPHLVPLIAICDPELTDSCPPRLTAVSGADALTHAIEAFTALRRHPDPKLPQNHVFVGKNILSDQHALRAISLISQNLLRAYRNGDDHVARDNVMLGATLAGLAFGAAGTAAAHAVQYPVGAATHTPHGAGVAVVMPYVMQMNLNYAKTEMVAIAGAMGLDLSGKSEAQRAQAAIEETAQLFQSLGIPKTLSDLGLPEDRLDWVSQSALAAKRLIKNNPRMIDPPMMQRLVCAAFSGDRNSLMV